VINNKLRTKQKLN